MTVTSRELIIVDEAEAMRAYDDVEVIGFDLETTGLHPIRNRPAVIAFAVPGLPPVSLHYPSHPPSDRIIEWLNKKILVGHNITAFDIPFLTNYGFDVEKAPAWYDTMTAEQLVMQSDKGDVKKNVKDTIKRRLGVTIAKDLGYHSWAQPELNQEQLEYVVEDIIYLTKVREKQLEKLSENGLDDAWEIEQGIAPVVTNMISTGMPIHFERLNSFLRTAAEKLEESSVYIESHIGTRSINSPKKLIQGFRTELGVDIPNTSDDTLQKLAGEPGVVGRVATEIRKARQHRKRFMYDNDWIGKYVVNGRVHASYKTQAVETGRFSSSDPNMQQTPRDMRPMYGYDDDSDIVIVKADFAQIEVLVSAVLMKEPKLIQWVEEGRDVHTQVAAMMYNKDAESVTKEERRIAKAGSFTLLFAGGERSLIATSRDAGYEMTREEASEVISRFFKIFPTARKFIRQQYSKADSAQRMKHSVNLRIPRGPRRSLQAKTATGPRIVNTIVQGTAAVGLKRAMMFMRERGVAHLVRATIHDEIVLECQKQDVDDVMEIVGRSMRDGMEDIIGVPPNVEIEWGPYWS